MVDWLTGGRIQSNRWAHRSVSVLQPATDTQLDYLVNCRQLDGTVKTSIQAIIDLNIHNKSIDFLFMKLLVCIMHKADGPPTIIYCNYLLNSSILNCLVFERIIWLTNRSWCNWTGVQMGLRLLLLSAFSFYSLSSSSFVSSFSCPVSPSVRFYNLIRWEQLGEHKEEDETNAANSSPNQ